MLRFAACLLLQWIWASALLAQPTVSPSPGPSPSPTPALTTPLGREIQVGLVAFPPLVVDLGHDQWGGVSVEVWREITRQLRWKYTFVHFDNHQQLIQALESGAVDLAVPSIPVSALAPNDIDFSQPFFASQYAVAISPRFWRVTWFNSLQALWNAGLAELALVMLGLLVSGGAMIYICERRENPGEFGGSFLEGLGHGIWWSAVTMTTVGYGDKSPRTFAGRVVAFVWMFLGFILLSIFVSALVSNISSQNRSGATLDRQMHHMKMGVIKDSPAAQFLANREIAAQTFSTLPDLGLAFARGQVDAVFADTAHLQHADWSRVGFRPVIIPQSAGGNWYSFAMKYGSPLASPLNRQILDFIETQKWSEIVSANAGPVDMPPTW